MKPSDDDVKRLFAESHVQVDPGREERILGDALREVRQRSGGAAKEKERSAIGRTIMSHKRISLTAAAAVLIGAVVILGCLASLQSGVAFAEVARQMRSHSYTFDLMMHDEGDGGEVLQAAVLEPGRMRFSAESLPGMGHITSIVDTQRLEGLVLFHNNRTAIAVDHPVPNRNAGSAGLLGLATAPVSELWKLRDGTEESLGRETIDGVEAKGFRVVQEDPWLRYTLDIWADAQTGKPVRVEIVARSKESAAATPAHIQWTLSNFNLNAELDREAFSLVPPEGYTLAYQKELDEIGDGETGDEAAKIVEAIRQWEAGDQDAALAALEGVDWDAELNFGAEYPVFWITEQEYVTLRPEAQQEVIGGATMKELATVRSIARELAERAKADVQAGRLNAAEAKLVRATRLGELFNRTTDQLLIARLVGYAVRSLALEELAKVYDAAGQTKKAAEARRQYEAVRGEVKAIKDQARGR